MIETLRQDLRYAIRTLRQSPLFTAVVVLTLALGIGATSTLFTVVDAVLLRPLPYPDPERLVSISDVSHGTDQRSSASINIFAWRQQSPAFSDIAMYTGNSAVYSGTGDPVQLDGALATADLFPLLGTHAIVGRTFANDEDAAGGPNVVILSRTFWQESLGGNLGVVGRTLTLGGNPYTVIGVVDERTALPRAASYWLPLRATPTGAFTFFYSTVARLKPGVSINAAQEDLQAITTSLDAARPAPQRGGKVAVMTLHDRMFGSVQKPLTLLFGAVVFLLLIACANVANLLLARGASRRREMAVRLALGASRWRLARQLLLESLLLAVAGAGVGMLLPVWAVGVLVGLSPETIGRVGGIHVNAQVAVFTAAVGVLTGLLFGILPALTTARGDALDPLKEGAVRAGGSPRQHRIRRALVVGELATALVLMVGAGLLTKSFVNVMAVDVGFQPEHLVAASVRLPRARYADQTAQRTFFDALVERVGALPGVKSAALSNAVPGNGFAMTMPLSLLSGGGDDSARMAIVTVGREYAKTVGLQLRSGRFFDASDVIGSPPVVMLSVSATKMLFPAGDAVGKQLQHATDTGQLQPTVVGVVKDVPQGGIDVTPLPQVYFPREQMGGGESFVVVRSSGDPAQLEAMIRHAVASVDRQQPVASFQRIDETLARSVAPRRLNFLLIDLFAGVALLLAAIGLYGVMAFQVAQRTREMGIRMALGATGGAVGRLVLRQGLGMVAAGCLVGVPLALAASRVLSSFLYGVGVRDLTTFVVGPVVLGAIALIACYIPARRATRVDPVVALRNE